VMVRQGSRDASLRGMIGTSVPSILIDAPATNRRSSITGVSATLLWCTDRMPADNAVGTDIEDMGARLIGTAPPIDGTRFAIVELAPGVRTAMHRTETVDYIVNIIGRAGVGIGRWVGFVAAG
jgi:hypothetical protein